MKRTKADRVGTAGHPPPPGSPLLSVTGDGFVHSPAPAPSAASSRVTGGHVSPGNLLWTLTKGNSTAEARRWVTATGFELELQIWTGPRVQGDEDLSWVRVFASEEPLADTARAKKRQLEASGWIADIHTTPL